MKNNSYISFEETLDWVRSHPLSDGRTIPICIWSHAGVGPTQKIQNYAKEHGMEIRSIFPAMFSAASEVSDAFQPTHNQSSSPGILHIDEFNRAKPNILNAFLEIIGEGKNSNTNWQLPDGWIIVANCNPNQNQYNVQEMDSALTNRMMHVIFSWQAAGWQKWVNENINEDLLKILDKDQHDNVKASTGADTLPADVRAKLSTNPRTLTYFSALYEDGMGPCLLYKLAGGLLGESAAETLFKNLTGKSFQQYQLDADAEA